jgi:spore coat protein A, manganese oxidase
MSDPDRPELSRRRVIELGAVALAGTAALPALSSCSPGGTGGGANTSTEGSAGVLLPSRIALPERFRRPLPLPPVLEPVRREDDTDHYEISQKAASLQILDGPKTEVWGYDGIVPGPTIVSERGRRTVVTHHNELPVPVVVHLHGGKTAAEHDGYPTDLILPADGEHHGSGHAGNVVEGSRDYVYEMDQPASTLWYHDHRMDFTGPQVYKGLAGFHLIHDEEEDALDLPSGERDIPLMIMDRAFAEDGSFLYPSIDPTLTSTPGVTAQYMSGVLGDCILVNGAAWPVLEVANTKYRFRMLNASNARRYRLTLDRDLPFTQIGSDQGLLSTPVEHAAIDIAQAERFDVVVDFSSVEIGTRVTMRNDFGRDGTADVMQFLVAVDEPDSGPVPDRLGAVEPLEGTSIAAEREFVFARGGAEAHGMTLWTVNGEPFSTETSAAIVRSGTTERWTIRAQNVEHPFHIHLAPFQVIGRDGNDGPGPYNHGWKDTVNLDNGGRVDLLIRFEQHTGKYVFHCHNLEHEDMMMMANFEVV